MTEASEIFRELVLRYEESVDEKKKKLADYRRQAEAYTSFLENDINEDQKRLERLRLELASIETAKANQPLAPDTAPLSAPSLPNKVTAGTNLKRTERPSGSQSELIRHKAREILAQEGRPLMQSQLKAKMQEMGIEIISSDPKELIRAALKGRPEFRHIRGEGWALVDA